MPNLWGQEAPTRVVPTVCNAETVAKKLAAGVGLAAYEERLCSDLGLEALGNAELQSLLTEDDTTGALRWSMLMRYAQEASGDPCCLPRPVLDAYWVGYASRRAGILAEVLFGLGVGGTLNASRAVVQVGKTTGKLLGLFSATDRHTVVLSESYDEFFGAIPPGRHRSGQAPAAPAGHRAREPEVTEQAVPDKDLVLLVAPDVGSPSARVPGRHGAVVNCYQPFTQAARLHRSCTTPPGMPTGVLGYGVLTTAYGLVVHGAAGRMAGAPAPYDGGYNVPPPQAAEEVWPRRRTALLDDLRRGRNGVAVIGFLRPPPEQLRSAPVYDAEMQAIANALGAELVVVPWPYHDEELPWVRLWAELGIPRPVPLAANGRPPADPQGAAPGCVGLLGLDADEGRWFIQATRWLTALDKQCLFQLPLEERLQNLAVLYPCEVRQDDRRTLLLPSEPDGTSQVILGRPSRLAVGRDPNPGTVKIARLPSSGADSAYSIDWGRCRPDRIVARDTEAAFPIGTRLAAYEPYADYASSEWRALDLLPQAAQLLSGPAPSRDWRLEPSKDPEWRSVFVDEVLASRAERLWLVQGPPGTGKTTLMAQAAQRILRQEPKARVLFLAQTHRALDEIRAKLDEVGVPHHSHRVEGQVQVRTLAAAAVAPAVPDGGYDYVFVDEASQVTIALGLVAVGKCEPGQGVLRLFGDDRQLDPVFPVVQYPQQLREAWRSMNTPDHAGFHQCTRELLQGGRLPLRDPAALASVDGLAELTEAALALPWSRSWLGCAAAELPGLGSLLAVRKTMLTRGHRLAPVLTTVVSTLWYQSQLQSCVDSADAFAISGAALGVAHGPARQTLGQLIRPLLQHEIVVLIHGHEADRSQVNEFEAAVAVHAKRVLDARPGQDRKRVGIVTPFRRQEKAIDLLWRQFEQPALGPDELATPERYQGRDLDAAVVSLSVGDANTYNRPGRVYTPNKLTVAVSRARYRLLVMVPRTLLGACAVANPNSQAYLDSVRSFVAEVEAVQGKRGRASVMRLA